MLQGKFWVLTDRCCHWCFWSSWWACCWGWSPSHTQVITEWARASCSTWSRQICRGFAVWTLCHREGTAFISLYSGWSQNHKAEAWICWCWEAGKELEDWSGVDLWPDPKTNQLINCSAFIGMGLNQAQTKLCLTHKSRQYLTSLVISHLSLSFVS